MIYLNLIFTVECSICLVRERVIGWIWERCPVLLEIIA